MYRWLLSVFGSGYSPVMPGTCGSAVTAGIILLSALSGNAYVMLGVTIGLAILGFVSTAAFGDKFIEQYGKDPGQIVSDEECGQAVTLLWLWPIEDWSVRGIIVLCLTGFVLFRIFDIIKPSPVRDLEKIKGAWGVLLDDVMAGIYAAVVLQVLWRMGWLNGLMGISS